MPLQTTPFLPIEQDAPKTHLYDVAVKKAYYENVRGGEIAIMARDILQAPIWHHYLKAAKYDKMHIPFRFYKHDNGFRETFYVETENALKLDELKEQWEMSPASNRSTQGGRVSPGGLLRYQDLDILVAFSHHYTANGHNPDIIYEKNRLMNWLGYKNSGGNADYDQVRASILRLANTRVKIWSDGPSNKSLSMTLLELPHYIRSGGQGRGLKSVLKATLSNSWTSLLKGEKSWNSVNTVLYEMLLRYKRTDGLARAIFLFMCSWEKNKKRTYSIKATWLRDRYADWQEVDYRHENYGLKHKNPFKYDKKLKRALNTIRESGVATISEVKYNVNYPNLSDIVGHIRGPEEALALIETFKAKGKRLVSIDKSAQELLFYEDARSSTIESNFQDDEAEIEHIKKKPKNRKTFSGLKNAADKAVDKYDAVVEALSLEDQVLENMQVKLQVWPKVIKEALAAGWPTHQLINCIGFHYYSSINKSNMGAYIATYIRAANESEEHRKSLYSQEAIMGQLGDQYEIWKNKIKEEFWPQTYHVKQAEANPVHEVVRKALRIYNAELKNIYFTLDEAEKELAVARAYRQLTKQDIAGRFIGLQFIESKNKARQTLINNAKANIAIMLSAIKNYDLDAFFNAHWGQ